MDEILGRNLYAKLNVVRLELSKEMKKGGKNTYSKYDYFQLQDFMPKALELCNDQGLFTKFWIDKEKQELPSKKTTQYMFNNETGEKTSEIISEENNFQYIEYANLLVVDVETGDEELFRKETANVSLQAAQPIQNLGGKSTYMKRYMYMDVFEINENDAVEGETGKPAPKVEVKETKVVTKPVVKAVETKPVNEEIKPVNEEIKVEEKVEETTESVDVSSTDDLMSMETKLMIASKIKEAGLDPRTQIVEFAKELGTDVPLLKESHKEILLEMIEKKVGGN